jgi:hypothetical protein
MKDGCYWWQESNIKQVLPYTYPASRVKAAEKKIRENGRRFEQNILSITKKSSSLENMVRDITRYIQQSIIHNPIFQPSRSSKLYALAGKYCIDIEKTSIGTLLHKLRLMKDASLIEDPDILVELGEARCGQCAKMLCEALNFAGIKSNVLQLKNHIVSEVFLNNTSYIIDADAFKNGIFIEVAGGLAATKDVLENPYLVDQFKHTGLMFRRDSIYAYNKNKQKAYSGYIDLYSPETDGQISGKFGASKKLYPPGVPQWKTASGSVTLKANKRMTLEYACAYADRASGYMIKCGRRSKGYSYDRLILKNLANETSGDVFELETKETYIEVGFMDPGVYYLTVASIPYYIKEFPSYLWWSDELTIRVVP